VGPGPVVAGADVAGADVAGADVAGADVADADVAGTDGSVPTAVPDGPTAPRWARGW